MEDYLKFFEQRMSATPLAGTELSKKLTAYTQQNVETAFAVAKKLTQALYLIAVRHETSAVRLAGLCKCRPACEAM